MMDFLSPLHEDILRHICEMLMGDRRGYWIADLGSRNGTFVNGVQVGQDGQRLNNWDRVELGGMETHWVFMESQDTVEVQRPG